MPTQLMNVSSIRLSNINRSNVTTTFSGVGRRAANKSLHWLLARNESDSRISCVCKPTYASHCPKSRLCMKTDLFAVCMQSCRLCFNVKQSCIRFMSLLSVAYVVLRALHVEDRFKASVPSHVPFIISSDRPFILGDELTFQLEKNTRYHPTFTSSCDSRDGKRFCGESAR